MNDDNPALTGPRIADRIENLRSMKDGWRDGEGLAPSPEILARAEEVIWAILDQTGWTERPHLYPTLRGGIVAEWDAQEGAPGMDLEVWPDGDGVRYSVSFETFDGGTLQALLRWLPEFRS